MVHLVQIVIVLYPTQKAIKTYIPPQIGGGVATLNVNSVTAGTVEITGDTISPDRC